MSFVDDRGTKNSVLVGYWGVHQSSKCSRMMAYGAAATKTLIRAAAVFSEEKLAFVCWQSADAE